MAESDLKPHTFTREEQIRGGQSHSIMKSLVKRKKCSKNCPLFHNCPFTSMGLKYNRCYLNCAENPTLKKFVGKIFEGDEKDFHDAVALVVSDMARIGETEDDGNINAKKKIVEALKLLNDMRFGTKGKIEHSGKVDVELFKKWLKNEQA